MTEISNPEVGVDDSTAFALWHFCIVALLHRGTGLHTSTRKGTRRLHPARFPGLVVSRHHVGYTYIGICLSLLVFVNVLLESFGMHA